MSKSTCPQCQGSGFILIRGKGIKGRCDCWKQGRTEQLLARSAIPPRFSKAKLDTFETLGNPYLEQALTLAEHFVQEYPMNPPGTGLLFIGRPGLGKTHLAIGIIEALMRTKSVQCLFVDFPTLLKKIQYSYNPTTQISEESLVTPYRDAEVLVVDDVGSMKPSPWVVDEVRQIVNARYLNNRSTILTTNYADVVRKGGRGFDLRLLLNEAGDVDQFKFNQLRNLGVIRDEEETLADRIGELNRSRLVQMCTTVEMDGEDYRRKVPASRTPSKV
jgi:DNA replication protein DnaC